jgi:hypothetical protein
MLKPKPKRQRKTGLYRGSTGVKMKIVLIGYLKK